MSLVEGFNALETPKYIQTDGVIGYREKQLNNA
jgi:hypothetical protein